MKREAKPDSSAAVKTTATPIPQTTPQTTPPSESAAPPAETGAAAAVGGAALGALAGAAGGPVGAIVGAIAGGVGGAYVGRALAGPADPTVEAEYWRSEYPKRPYYVPERSYEDYEAAYRAGWEAYDPETKSDWADREELARQRWEAEGGSPTMSWEEARAASQDAYYRLHEGRPR